MRIDWTLVLEELALLLGEPVDNGSGVTRLPVTTARLAVELGVPRGTLIGWIDGTEPRHVDGEMLLMRWCRLTGKPKEFAPLERRPLSGHSRRA